MSFVGKPIVLLVPRYRRPSKTGSTAQIRRFPGMVLEMLTECVMILEVQIA